MQLKRPMKRPMKRSAQSGPPFLAGGFGALATIAVLVCLATGACVPAPVTPPPAPPPPAPSAPAAPPPIVTQVPTPSYQDWMDAPQTPGDWRYRALGATRRASFGEAAGAPLFEMVCDSGGVVQLLRSGTAGNAMRILSETAERSVPATAREGAIVAQLTARDPLLDAMAFSKGRFAVEVAGLPTLYLPAWPEVTRVIEDCR